MYIGLYIFCRHNKATFTLHYLNEFYTVARAADQNYSNVTVH